MSLTSAPPSTDLYLPRPSAGEEWDPFTIHTHYFGFSIPEAAIGCFIYVRYQPAFGLAGAGVSIFRGTDNHTVLDAAHLNYEVTSPWPTVADRVITTANGLRIEFAELGREVLLSYSSPDRTASFEIRQVAVSPLVARGHVMPGEEDHHTSARNSGGSEQFMHCTGRLTLGTDSYAIDCTPIRDRSWNQVRTERRGVVQSPPIGWSPMYFGPDLALSQIGIEAPETKPAWSGLYAIPAGQPNHHFGYVISGDSIHEIIDVRRNVHTYDPVEFMPLQQELEVTDSSGRTRHFVGEALALCPVPAWPNLMAHDSVYRWTDEQGRVSHQPYQEMWFDTYQHAMKQRHRN